MVLFIGSKFFLLTVALYKRTKSDNEIPTFKMQNLLYLKKKKKWVKSFRGIQSLNVKYTSYVLYIYELFYACFLYFS